MITEETQWNTSWALADHLGTIRDWVDAATGSTTHYVYASFGRLLSANGGDPTSDGHLFGYTGRETDADTLISDHWMYYRARYYNPSNGRFVSQDPIGFLAGDANLYRYVGNGVTGATDPSGLDQTTINGKVVNVTRKGHHLIPVELWDEFGFDWQMGELLDSESMRIKTVDHYWTDDHADYNSAVHADLNEQLDKYLNSKDIKAQGGKLTLSQQRDFLLQYRHRITCGDGPKFLKKFNELVPLDDAMEEIKTWRKSISDSAEMAIPFMRAVTKTTRIGGLFKVAGRIRIPVVGSFLALPTALLLYNNLVADGWPRHEAAVLAGIDNLSPFGGVQEALDAANKYNGLSDATRLYAMGYIEHPGTPLMRTY